MGGTPTGPPETAPSEDDRTRTRGKAARALLSAEEVAAYFGVERTTVYRWGREGRMPCLKIGKHWRVRREELEDFLREAEGSEGLLNWGRALSSRLGKEFYN